MNARASRGLVLARDFMNHRVYTVREGEKVCDVVRVLTTRGYSGAPVVDERGKLIGMLSERDCIQALIRACVHGLPSSHVRDVMSRDLVTVAPDAHLLTVANHFLYGGKRRLPVVDDEGYLLGQISRSDLLKKAIHIFDEAPNRDAAILYLSAINGTIPPS